MDLSYDTSLYFTSHRTPMRLSLLRQNSVRCSLENPEPTSPYGTKALGEPPACSGAPAIRNAILRAEEYAASGFIADVQENIELMKVGTDRQNLPDAP